MRKVKANQTENGGAPEPEMANTITETTQKSVRRMQSKRGRMRLFLRRLWKRSGIKKGGVI
jgi:hypothetical protein